MSFLKNVIASVVPGAAFGAAAVALAEWILRNLDKIVQWVGEIIEMEAAEMAMISTILGTLRGAELTLPWKEAIIIGVIVNVLIALLIASGKIRKFVINVLLMIPAVAAVLWFTKVNGIMLGDVIEQLIPLLESGLL